MWELDSTDGMISNKEGRTLAKYAAKVSAEQRIIELGSRTGLSTCWLALGAIYGLGAIVHAVDPWAQPRENSDDDPSGLGGEGVHQQFLANLHKFALEDRVVWHRDYSLEMASTWERTIGLIFIDAVHEEDPIREDFLAWEPFITRKGYVVFHDFSDTFPGTEQVIIDTVLPMGFKEIKTPRFEDESIWVGQKP